MKDSEIHEGLPQKEIRDFLGMQFVVLYERELKNKCEFISPNLNDIAWAIARAKEKIRWNQENINILTQRQAVITLIETQGWEEHDVSDYTRRDGEIWMSFIGTEAEYEELITKLEKNE